MDFNLHLRTDENLAQFPQVQNPHHVGDLAGLTKVVQFGRLRDTLDEVGESLLAPGDDGGNMPLMRGKRAVVGEPSSQGPA